MFRALIIRAKLESKQRALESKIREQVESIREQN